MPQQWDWRWDPTLYTGSARHYPRGRMPYPAELATAVRDALGLDGRGRLLDVGCGPGSLTLLLAPLFEEAVGVDADPGMIAEAARQERRRADRPGVRWLVARAEELPPGLGRFRAVTFAQSFHWTDQPRVARRLRDLLAPDGAWVHVSSTTHCGVAGDDPLPHPRPPWDAVDALVARYLGPVRRAGAGTLPEGTRGGEEDVLRAAGYTGPVRLEVGGGEVVTRGVDELMAAVFSLSGSAPHLFGDELPRFDADLRSLLTSAADGGRFSERRRSTRVVIWRP